MTFLEYSLGKLYCGGSKTSGFLLATARLALSSIVSQFFQEVNFSAWSEPTRRNNCALGNLFL